MLFVQALEKAQAKPLKHFTTQKKVTLAIRESSIDSVDLSDASSHILTLSHENAQTSSPELTLESALLQQILFYLTGLPVPIYSIAALKLQDDSWDINIAKPPKVSPSYAAPQSTCYSNAVRHLPTEIINYPFSIHVIANDLQSHYFEIDLRVARFTQQKNQWQQPEIERIKLAPVQLSHDSRFLNLAEKHLTYFFDQDGDSQQATPLLERMKNPPLTPLLPDNNLFSGMRLWRCRQDKIDIALMGDAYLGAIHTASMPF